MKGPAQVAASIDRFRRGFWAREQIDRPPVGIVPARTWLPIGYLKTGFARDHVLPSDLSATRVRSDYEDAVIGRRIFCDDWLPYRAPWRAVPWLEAISGCGVRFATGALAPEPWAASADEMADRLAADARAGCAWYDALWAQTTANLRDLPGDCFASPTILRGPSDVLAAARDLRNFYLDLHDAPGAVARAAACANSLLLDVLVRHFSVTPPRLGGYGHIYGYWAPGPTNVLQEDVLGMAGPAVYRDIFMPLNAEVVRRLGAYTLFHLHSTGMRHWRHVLAIPNLAGLEITVESNGPALLDLAPTLRTILEASRLMLFVDAWFDQLPELMRRIPRDGLYLIISDRYINSEPDYRAFLRENFGSDG